MKVLVAGATGAIGAQLVPRLVERGHDVIGLTRSPDKRATVRAMGATPAVADALDADAIARVVAETEPEAIIHQLTALSRDFDLRHFDRTFATTNRLRTEGTDHLLAAGRAVGVRRFLAQSFAGWPHARVGGPVKSEEDPWDEHPLDAMRTTFAALRYLEQAVLGAGWTDGIVLRYGGFYGPGTSLGRDGDMTEVIRKRQMPIVGSGSGVWSFIHVADAAEATALALERAEPGVYNVVDDEPAPVAVWLPVASERLGVAPPRRVPRFVGRLVAGKTASVMMTEVRGASNAKARRELGWEPQHASWRDGFSELAA